MATRTKKKSEKQIEEECLFWLNSQPDVFAIKINNNAQYSEELGARLKPNKWCPNGTPDCAVMTGIGFFWIEFKKDGGKQSDDQIAFQNKMKKFGIGYYVVHSVEEARAALEREGELWIGQSI